MLLGRLSGAFRRGRGKDRSLDSLHGEAATSSIENAGVAYQSPSVIAAGGDAQTVSTLSAVSNLVLAVLLFAVPRLVEKRKGSLKRTTVLISIINTMTWLPLAVVMLLTGITSPVLICGLWILNLVPSVIGYPLRDEWLASLVPAERMGRYLSVRSAFVGAFYLGAFLAMGLILENTGQRSSSYGYVFGLALLASLASTFLYVAIRPPGATHTSPSKPLTVSEFLRNSFRQHVGLFVVFVSLYAFAVNLAGPPFAFYMLDEISLSISMFTGIIAAEYVARIASLSFWGRLVDKRGGISIMNWSARLIPFVPVLWIFSGNPAYLVLVQLVSGVAWAAFDLSVQSYLNTATRPEQRLRLIAYHRGLTTLGAALGALVGGAVLMRVFPLNGSHILGLFLVSGILRMVLALMFLPKLTWQEGPRSTVRAQNMPGVRASILPYRVPIFHCPWLWSQFEPKREKGNYAMRAARLRPAFIKRRYDPNFGNRVQVSLRTAISSTDTSGRHTVLVTKAQERKRQALFGHPELWADYLRHSLSLDTYGTESRLETFSNPRRGHVNPGFTLEPGVSASSGKAGYSRGMPSYPVANRHTPRSHATIDFPPKRHSDHLQIAVKARDISSKAPSNLSHERPPVFHRYRPSQRNTTAQSLEADAVPHSQFRGQ